MEEDTVVVAPPAGPESDAEGTDLLAAARAGESWALTRLYERYAPKVAGYLRAGGASDPEDATSEVFLGVLRGLGRFEGDEAAFRRWLFTIAHRRLVDDRRRRRWRHVAPIEPVVDDHSDAVADRVDAAHIRRVLDRLRPLQREVLLLRVVAGLSHQEVARILRRPAGTVRVLQHRALNALRRALESELGYEE